MGNNASSWHKNVVGLTGTIGSGKSTVSSILKSLGAFVINADDLSREAVTPGSAGLEKIRKLFGAEAITSEGALNRKKLGEIVFNDRSKRKELEKIIHPIVRDIAKSKFEAAFKKNYPVYVYETPLLFEAGLNKDPFLSIVVVTSPREQCLARIIKRDSLTAEEVNARLDTQKPAEDKVKFADYLVDNSGNLTELEDRVRILFHKLSNLKRPE